MPFFFFFFFFFAFQFLVGGGGPGPLGPPPGHAPDYTMMHIRNNFFFKISIIGSNKFMQHTVIVNKVVWTVLTDLLLLNFDEN